MVGLCESLGVLKLDGRGRKCELDHHLVAVVPLADEERIDEPEAVTEGLVYHCMISAVNESTVCWFVVVRWFVGFGTVGLLGLVCCCCVAILLAPFFLPLLPLLLISVARLDMGLI